MTIDELRGLLPKHKSDYENTAKLLALGYPALAPVMSELIDWSLDPNWPVTCRIAAFFEKIGDHFAQHLAAYLGNPGVHLYDKVDALSYLGNEKWSPAAAAHLAPGLESHIIAALGALDDPATPLDNPHLCCNQGPPTRSTYINMLGAAVRYLRHFSLGDTDLLSRANRVLLACQDAGEVFSGTPND